MPQIGFFSGAPGPGELILIFLVVLLLFGPRKLPGFARTLGNLMRQLRRASNDFRDQLLSVEEDMNEGIRAVIDEHAEADDQAEDDVYSTEVDDAAKGADDITVESDTGREDRPLAG